MKIFLKSTRLTTIFLFVFCLLNIVLSTEKAVARPSKCEQIRQIRRLADREDLDGQNLAILEERFCEKTWKDYENNWSFNDASEDCINLTLMKRFAQMTTKNSNFVYAIESIQPLSCRSTQEHLTIDYPNGETAKFGSTWYYPNGETAKFGSTWYYPNGKQAKWNSTWYYPNGETAKFGSTWYYPNGKQASTSWNQTEEFWHELKTLELFWRKDKISQEY